MTNSQENIGSRIKEARLKAGLSQEVLAELTSISTSFMGQIERGERSPSMPVLTRLSKALEFPLSRIVDQHEVRETRAEYKVRPKLKQLIKLSERADDATLDIFLKIFRVLKRHERKKATGA